MLLVGQKRVAAARGLSVVLIAITLGLGAVAAVYFSQGASPAVPNRHFDSSSLSSSSSVFSGSGSTSSNSGVQQVNQSSVRYPLMWAPKPLGAGCDEFPLCVEAVLGFAGVASLPPPPPPPPTTVIQDNTTTIVISSTTTYISGVSTGVVYPPEDGSYPIAVFALVQDAATGQNITVDQSSLSYITGGCLIQPFGFTDCYAGGGPMPPPGHDYKLTVFVTKGDLPCSIRPAGDAGLNCTAQLLAPIQTITMTG